MGILQEVLVLLLLSVSDARPLSYTLTTVPDPVQGGMTAPNCSVGCIQGSGTTVGLFALPYAGYVFGGWGGACSGNNPSASVSMTADRSCTAGFTACPDKSVGIGTTGYDSLSSAYAAADEGDEIKLLAANLPESPSLDRSINVSIKGGYSCGLSASQSMTLLQGPLTIGRGSATVENLVIVGPISAAVGIPPAIPSLPEATGFDNIINNPAVSGDATQTATGTTGNDRITQYGGTGAVVQTATGDSGNDWILQVCGGISCSQSVNSGDGIDTVFQYGGPGTTSQFINGPSGDKTYVQVGGASPNTQIAFGSTGSDRIIQYGGASDDLMNAEGAAGDDRIEQYGQGGDDTMVVSAGTENDQIYQDGGAGNDTLSASGDYGDDRIIQKGGAGDDTIGVIGGMGNDSIQVEGGIGNDVVRVTPSSGNNTITIDAGAGNDTIDHNIFDIDTAFIDGGDGVDKLVTTHDWIYGNSSYRIVDGTGTTIYEAGSGGSVITVRNVEFLIDDGENFNYTLDNVTFTLTFAARALNSVPAGADRVTISIDSNPDTRIYRLTPELGSAVNPLTVSFVAVAGNHTYTAKAWSGSTLMATIGPINFTTVDGFPLTIPLAFAFPAFDSYHTDVGTSGADEQITTGSDVNRDRVVQYGGAGNDLQSVSPGGENDWCEQYGGDGDDTMVVRTGTGDDYACQSGGQGNNNLTLHTGEGNNWSLQFGGIDTDTINSSSGSGDDYIRIEGAGGNDSIRVQPNEGNDSVVIDAGPGNDSITYDVSAGTDTAAFDGGTGTDSLTVNENGQPFVLKNSSGNTLFDHGSVATTITVVNLEQITVMDTNGNTIFSWSAP